MSELDPRRSGGRAICLALIRASLLFVLVTATLASCAHSPEALLLSAHETARQELALAQAEARRSGSATWTPRAYQKNEAVEDPSLYNFKAPGSCVPYRPGPQPITLGADGAPAKDTAILYSSSHGGHYGWLVITADGQIRRASVHGGLGTPGPVEPFPAP